MPTAACALWPGMACQCPSQLPERPAIPWLLSPHRVCWRLWGAVAMRAMPQDHIYIYPNAPAAAQCRVAYETPWPPHCHMGPQCWVRIAPAGPRWRSRRCRWHETFIRECRSPLAPPICAHNLPRLKAAMQIANKRPYRKVHDPAALIAAARLRATGMGGAAHVHTIPMVA